MYIPPLQTLFLLLSPVILELIFILHTLRIFLFFHKDVFAIDGFSCWAIRYQGRLGCSFCGAVILLGGAEGVAPSHSIVFDKA